MVDPELLLRYFRRWQNPVSQEFANTLERLPAGSNPPEELRVSVSGVKQQMPLSQALLENQAVLKLLIGNPPDFVVRTFELGAQERPAALVFLDTMTKKALIMQEIEGLVIRLRHESIPESPGDLPQFIKHRGLISHSVTERQTIGQAMEAILDGDTILLIEGLTVAWGLSTRGVEFRKPTEPVAEPVVRGPKEGFTEALYVNLSLVRRRVKDERLRVESLTLGTRTGTHVLVLSMAGLATPDLVAEVHRRLKAIQVDGVLESGYIEELIVDHPYSPFPLVTVTERPDVVVAGLLEGRVAILTDGTPHALLAPSTFFGHMQSAEDYSNRWAMASMIRLIRYVFMGIALLGPSIYIAMTTFHHETVPTNLLISIIAARETVPFPALLEALLMELTFETLREAGIRLPKPVGQAVSIVGALVIGDAAVRAGLISPVKVIVVATTAIASFAIPSFPLALAIRLLRFPMMLLAAALGAYGIVLGLFVLAVHLSSLRSFGVPYMAPVMPPTLQGMEDVVIRAPWWWMRSRPKQLPVGNRIRQGTMKPPGPPATGGG